MSVHDFSEQIDYSAQYANAPWWREVYEEAFPTITGMLYIRENGWAQKAGVDRQLFLRDGTVIEIDEKVRRTFYPDFFLEFLSDRDRNVPGWVDKDLRADFIAYAWAPARRCYLLPHKLLRRAWKQRGKVWRAAYGERPAQNKGWVTLGCPVPIDVVLSAISNATVVDMPLTLQEAEDLRREAA